MNAKERRTDKRANRLDWLETAASKMAGALDAMQDAYGPECPEHQQADDIATLALKFFDDGPDEG